ncbi:MAG: sigma-54 dependent transcriptional regulator [Bacteroidota bacterium]
MFRDAPVCQPGEGVAYEAAAERGDLLTDLERRQCAVLVVGAAHPLAGGGGMLARIRRAGGGPKVIVITDKPDVPYAVRMIKSGVHDVLVRPVSGKALDEAIRSALGDAEPHRERMPRSTRQEAAGDLVGDSPAIREIRRTIAAVAPTDTHVFLSGESGTGKELVARMLHTQSTRSGGPFVAVNCAALPHDILENELFGHERGAFTGALEKKEGCFELAHGGTLLLDEIGEMTPDTQAKLLRAIESQSFRRLGGKQEVQVDVRIVAATNRETSEALAQGRIRADLYYRLSVIELEIPPLRERPEDIRPLVRHFLGQLAARHGRDIRGCTPGCEAALEAHAWPGNVRELRNAVERAVVLSAGPLLEETDLPLRIAGTARESARVHIPLGSTVEEAERTLILETLASVGNNKSQAARMLGVSRKTLHNKLNSFSLG